MSDKVPGRQYATSGMTNVCDRCGRGNRALFCIGCAGKLPGFAVSGTSAPQGMTSLEKGRAAARLSGGEQGAPGHQPDHPDHSDHSDHPAHPDHLGHRALPLLPETKSFWMVLGALAVAMTIGFVAVFVHVTDAPSPARGGNVALPAATTPPPPPDRMAAALPPPPVWHAQGPGSPAAQVPQAPVSTGISSGVSPVGGSSAAQVRRDLLSCVVCGGRPSGRSGGDSRKTGGRPVQ
ncbi:hypothetical protein QTH97_30735 [Variovorax sp. J22R24]|uniref:hypothetical protein n=1 Tax=Variovorax gracilis TaxID=3053502 RepID=UPI0025762FDE|nr:hypothetical protein [Variovorax sp. J22R24]MDM0109341.1 hypothetical protein [Variovorax sp. J22R24]